MAARLTNVLAHHAASGPMPGSVVSPERLLAAAIRILDANVLCAIATMTATGGSHINTAYFCYSDDLELYFLSHPESRHGRNLSATPSAAVAVYSSTQTWGGPDRGLQLFGTCGAVDGRVLERAERFYRERFPRFADLPAEDLARAYRLYRFQAKELKVLDDEEFGDGVLVRATIDTE